MDIEKLIEKLQNAAGGPEGIKMCHDAATTISALQAENEKLRAELEQAREKNAGLALALLTECAPNPDCLGDDEWRVIRAEIVQVKAERDAAVDCCNGYCASCLFVKDCAKHDMNDAAPTRWYYGDCEDWEWRGWKEG